MASLLVAGRIDGIHRLAHRWHPVVASDVILTVTMGLTKITSAASNILVFRSALVVSGNSRAAKQHRTAV
jgi:hypothetical protein